MIVVTGAFGFIGSCLVAELNKMGLGRQIIVVDDFYKDHKEKNLASQTVRDWVHRDLFLDWFDKSAINVSFVLHLGARTDTAEQSTALFDKLNVNYSKSIWELCTKLQIPMVYASSASVYGDGALGFSDDHGLTKDLKAINPYGQSKLTFDQWVLSQKKSPPQWAGLRFFNVYGPNEYHKGNMASVIFHAYNQIKKNGSLKLFQSHKAEYKDGEQLRDFVFVKDVIKVMTSFLENPIENGIYNLGTGKARTFNDLAISVFKSLDTKPKIEYIETPKSIRDSYQYFTEADLSKLNKQLPNFEPTSLEEGVEDYVNNYLKKSLLYN